MKQQSNPDASRSLPVRFEFTDPEAESVAIAGTFNHWQPDAKPMLPVGDHRWVKGSLLPPGTGEYCLVVNGQFRPDPRARESVANPFGGRNFVLNVGTQEHTTARVGKNKGGVRVTPHSRTFFSTAS